MPIQYNVAVVAEWLQEYTEGLPALEHAYRVDTLCKSSLLVE